VTSLAQRVSAFINAEGHSTQIDTSNDGATAIRFRSRGLKFTAWVTRDDDAYLQLSCAMVVDDGVLYDAPLLRALWDCQERFKCVKFSLENNGQLFVCSVEAFFAGPDGYQPVFWRSIGVIETALYAGLEEIRTKHSAKVAADKFLEELSNGGAR
jgi:hypothetical protein